jgi:hypothetical protein
MTFASTAPTEVLHKSSVSIPRDTITGKRPKRHWTVLAVCSVAALCLLGLWLWHDLSSGRAVYVVGDSITALSGPSISESLANAGYEPTIRATPGVKIGQAQVEVSSLARNQPRAWIIELGTDDAGANDQTWIEPFLAEARLISTASCVIYVTISPRAGVVGSQINTAIERLSKLHLNIHVLDWGQMEYTNPAWVSLDGIHPTPQGEAALANLETQELRQACPTH